MPSIISYQTTSNETKIDRNDTTSKDKKEQSTMKHRTPKINPTKSKNINVEYRDRTAKNTNDKKTTHISHTKKTQNNTQTLTNPDRHKPHRQHTKKGHCVKNNTIRCENQKTPSCWSGLKPRFSTMGGAL